MYAYFCTGDHKFQMQVSKAPAKQCYCNANLASLTFQIIKKEKTGSH